MKFNNLLAIVLAAGLIFIRYKFTIPVLNVGDGVQFATLITEVPKEKYGKCQLVFNKMVVTSSGLCKYRVGDEILIKGVVSKGDRGIEIKADDVSYNKTPWYGTVLREILQARGLVEAKVKEKLPEPEAGLLLGITLGVKNALPRDFYDKLVKTGTIHVAVVSGYNISLILSALLPVFGVIKKRVVRLIILSVSLLLYTTVVGFNPPVIRAMVMGIISFIGLVTGRQREALRVLLISCFFILFAIPSYLTDISFQLSFGASFGMLVFYNKFKNLLRLDLLGLEDGFYGSLSSQVVVLPLISFYFGRVSLVSLISNLLSLWVIAPATILGFALFVLMYVPLVSNIMTFIVYILLNYFVLINNFLADISYSKIEVKIGLIGLGVYYILLLGGLTMWKGENTND